MKKLVLGSLLAVAVSQAAGCIITDDTNDYAIVTAQWSLEQTTVPPGGHGPKLTCPPGTTTAAVYAQEVNTDYMRIGQPFIEIYDCDAGIGNSDPLPPTVYEMWVELTSEGGGQVYATSTSRNEASPTETFPDGYFLDVIDVDKTFKTTLLADGGYFQFDWDLRNTATNAPITCGSVPLVAMLSTSVTNSSNSVDDGFLCGENYGLSTGLLQGAYTVSVSATDNQHRGLGPPTVLANKQITAPNNVTDLHTVPVMVD